MKFLFLIFFIVTTNLSFSQERLVQPIDRINFKLFISEISYSKEFPISSKSTLEGAAGLGSLYHYENGLSNIKMQIRPEINFSYKYYYNIRKRFKDNKNIDNNSANYVGSSFTSYLSPLNMKGYNNKDFLMGLYLYWGLNRNLGTKGFQYNFLVGPGIGSKELSDSDVSLYIKTGFSYSF